MDYYRRFAEAHKRLKDRIHNFRIPLGPAGLFGMGCVYFATPVIIGYYVMEYCADVAANNHAMTLNKVKVPAYLFVVML